jgi:hypothetical protein
MTIVWKEHYNSNVIKELLKYVPVVYIDNGSTVLRSYPFTSQLPTQGWTVYNRKAASYTQQARVFVTSLL